jgi:hypothetical protein
VERQKVSVVDGLQLGKHGWMFFAGFASGCLVSVRVLALSFL